MTPSTAPAPVSTLTAAYQVLKRKTGAAFNYADPAEFIAGAQDEFHQTIAVHHDAIEARLAALEAKDKALADAVAKAA